MAGDLGRQGLEGGGGAAMVGGHPLLAHLGRAESGEGGFVSLETLEGWPSGTFHSLLDHTAEAAPGPNGQAGLGSQADAKPEGCL